MNLEIIDYKILIFIKKNPHCKKSDILNHFSKETAINYRLHNLLLKTEFSDFDSSYINQYNDYHWVKGEIVGQKYDNYYLTLLGEKALSDYLATIRENKSYTFKTSFLYPILSAVITAVVTAYITTILLISK